MTARWHLRHALSTPAMEVSERKLEPALRPVPTFCIWFLCNCCEDESVLRDEFQFSGPGIAFWRLAWKILEIVDFGRVQSHTT